MVYDALGKAPVEVFPIAFAAEPGLATGEHSGRLDGFYRLEGDRHVVER